jgi:hypothetical protein
MISNENDMLGGIPASYNLGDHNLLPSVPSDDSENPECETYNKGRGNNRRCRMGYGPAISRHMAHSIRYDRPVSRGRIHYHGLIIRDGMTLEGNLVQDDDMPPLIDRDDNDGME